VRPSDADRLTAVAELQRHCGEGRLSIDDVEVRAVAVWSATSRAELDAVTADLPGRPQARRVTAVLSSAHQRGTWRAGDRLRAVAVLGAADADLRDLDGPVEVRAVAVLGSIDVVVPPGTRVDLTGTGLLGSRKVRVRAQGRPGHDVSVRATAVLGTVRVVEHRPAP
jgi:hypothetical protein